MSALWILPVVGFIVIGWWMTEDVRRWANYRDPMTRTRDEIRALPETPEEPYDWDREQAA